MNKPTVIYIRRHSQQPDASDVTSMPRRGTPIGAIAFNYVLELDSDNKVADSYLEFSYSLVNSTPNKASGKFDVFNRKRTRSVVLSRFEKKRDCVDTGEPNYHKFDVPAQASETLRPYDALRLILRGDYEKEYTLPPRLVKAIEQMLSDNELRIERLEYLRSEGAIVARVRELLRSGTTTDEIFAQLARVRVGQSIEQLSKEELSKQNEDDFIAAANAAAAIASSR
jgi:hypothetical protein